MNEGAGPVPSYTGSCLCKAIRYKIEAPLRKVVGCHCEQCRRFHGHFAAYTAADRQCIRIEDEQRFLKWYRSSEAVQRGFCANCGSSVFWNKRGSELLRVAAGSLDQPSGLTMISHIYTRDKGDYYHLTDGLDKWPMGLPNLRWL